MSFLSERDFSSQTLVSETFTDTVSCLFDVKCRSGRCLGLVSYIFTAEDEVGSFNQMIAQFGRTEDVKDFMKDERARLGMLGNLTKLDVEADETICVIDNGFPEPNQENHINAACTIRDELFVIRIMMSVTTIGDDLKIPTIEKYLRRAVQRVQSLKAVP